MYLIEENKSNEHRVIPVSVLHPPVYTPIWKGLYVHLLLALVDWSVMIIRFLPLSLLSFGSLVVFCDMNGEEGFEQVGFCCKNE